MDDIRSFNFLQKKDIPVFAGAHVIEQLKREFAYVFTESKYPGVPQVDVNVIDNSPFEVNGISINPIEVMHYKLPVFGYRIGDFTYITDMKTIAEEELDKLKGTKVLVINALQKTSHISHLTLDEALQFTETVQAERTYFTHLSHRMGKHADVTKELPEGVKIAYDGLQIDL